MIDFSITFNLIAFCVVAGLDLIMLLASVVMIFRLHKGRMTFFGVLTYGLTWIVMIVSLAVTTLAIINRTELMDVTKLVKSLGGGVLQLCTLTFDALMMEIAVYALTVLSIAQLIIHPITWTVKKEYATPVTQADGNGYITVDESFDHFDETNKQSALDVESVEVEPSFEEPTPVVEEPVVDEPIVEEPVVDEPVVEEPVVEEPVVDEPVVDEPVVDEPVVEEP
ncbi:MAG: hypothetical protein IKC64_01775, partial [Clostridia bacterium]|nr:hypothetical protein [Clostridia bacterium]